MRVTDFSIDKRVRELWTRSPSVPQEDRFPVAIGRGGKKVDVYRDGRADGRPKDTSRIP